MIITVSLNPAVDKTLVVPNFASGVVNRVEQSITDAGGKGVNVSQVLKNLGMKSLAMGIAGGRAGRMIEEAVRTAGIDTDFLFVEGETRTNTKIVDTEGQITTDVNESGCEVAPEQLDALLSRLLARLTENDIVVLAGSLPKGAPADTYGKWTEACSEKGAKVFLDTSGEALRLGVKAKPYFIKPNVEELCQITGVKTEGLPDICREAQKLVAGGIKKVAVSMGAEGAVFVSTRRILYAEGLREEIHTTVGAGDAMVAAFVAGEEQHMEEWDTLMLGVAAGTAAAMTPGSAPADASDIFQLAEKVDIKKVIGTI